MGTWQVVGTLVREDFLTEAISDLKSKERSHQGEMLSRQRDQMYNEQKQEKA